MAYKTILSTPEFTVIENSETGKRAVDFNVGLYDDSPFTVTVPENQVDTLFEFVKKYLATK